MLGKVLIFLYEDSVLQEDKHVSSMKNGPLFGTRKHIFCCIKNEKHTICTPYVNSVRLRLWYEVLHFPRVQASNCCQLMVWLAICGTLPEEMPMAQQKNYTFFLYQKWKTLALVYELSTRLYILKHGLLALNYRYSSSKMLLLHTASFYNLPNWTYYQGFSGKPNQMKKLQNDLTPSMYRRIIVSEDQRNSHISF